MRLWRPSDRVKLPVQAPPTSGSPYSTSFSGGAENPISETGRWHHTPNPWAYIEIRTSPNRAVGTQTQSPFAFNDSYAYLAGFGNDVSIEATIYKDASIGSTPGDHEVELLLRVVDSSTQVHAYECNWSHTGSYQQIVKWGGDLGQYSELANTQNWTSLVTGDIVKATIVGTTITAYVKRVGDSVFTQMSQATDSSYSTGQPGIGMWLGRDVAVGDQPKFGFSSLSVTDI